MAISNLIVHFIDKPGAEQQARLSPRDSELPLTDSLETLVSKVHATYNGRSGKVYGFFEADTGTYPFSTWLRDWLAGGRDFVELSRQTMERFRVLADEAGEALSGYLLFARLQGQDQDQLLVLMLNTSRAVSINEALEINDAHHLDPGKVHWGAKVNLQAVQQGEEDAYVSFLKVRTAKQQTELFRRLLGCTEQMDSAEQTQALLKVFDDYCKAPEVSQGQASEFRQKAYDYCHEQVESGERVNLRELSCLMDTSDPDKFYNYVAEQPEGPAAEIPADKSSLRRFVRYSGSMKGLSLSFSEALLGEQVVYDEASDSVTIRGLPPTLKKQLLKRSGGQGG